jgi:hypothetical protein
MGTRVRGGSLIGLQRTEERTVRKQGDEMHLSRTEARAGDTPHIARYVLMISMSLVVILFAALLLFWR